MLSNVAEILNTFTINSNRHQKVEAIALDHTSYQQVVKICPYITNIRRRGKAQRVARLACASATVHFLLTYLLAMLVPPSE